MVILFKMLCQNAELEPVMWNEHIVLISNESAALLCSFCTISPISTFPYNMLNNLKFLYGDT